MSKVLAGIQLTHLIFSDPDVTVQTIKHAQIPIGSFCQGPLIFVKSLIFKLSLTHFSAPSYPVSNSNLCLMSSGNLGDVF